jgi:hypothetical protein
MTTSEIDQICCLLKQCKGICSIIKKIDDLERKKIMELELQEETKLLQFGATIENQSVKEALSRDFVLLVTNNQNFEYKEPTIILKAGDEIVGEQILDANLLTELRGKRGYFLSGNDFVIYTYKLRKMGRTQLRFITLPFSFPNEEIKKVVKDLYGAKDLICGWPSRAVDLYIKRLFNLDTKDIRLGTLLVGFNVEKKQ